MKRIIIGSIFLIAITSCGTSTENEGSNVTTSTDNIDVITDDTVVETIDQESKVNVELNNGEAWEANPETSEGVEQMILMSDGFAISTDTAAYREFENELHAEYKLIFKKCTMKGEAHNQLHNYLMPLKEKMGNLISTDIDACQAAHLELNDYLSEYKNYFK